VLCTLNQTPSCTLVAHVLLCIALVQELRSRLAESQQRQGELLRMAQDSRLEAGEWAEPACSVL
jgi:hypothetical protein